MEIGCTLEVSERKTYAKEEKETSSMQTTINTVVHVLCKQRTLGSLGLRLGTVVIKKKKKKTSVSVYGPEMQQAFFFIFYIYISLWNLFSHQAMPI